jgi:signal transduction histidine kinase
LAPENEDLNSIKKLMERLNASAVLPVKNGNDIIGLICLMQKQDKLPFSIGELILFSEIAAKAGNALINLDKHKKLTEQKHLMALGNMSAGLAHEIRNPLGAIKGAVQILSEAKPRLNEDESVFLDIIEEETNRLNRVVTNF